MKVTNDDQLVVAENALNNQPPTSITTSVLYIFSFFGLVASVFMAWYFWDSSNPSVSAICITAGISQSLIFAAFAKIISTLTQIAFNTRRADAKLSKHCGKEISETDNTKREIMKPDNVSVDEWQAQICYENSITREKGRFSWKGNNYETFNDVLLAVTVAGT
jgi:hypothetical protein